MPAPKPSMSVLFQNETDRSLTLHQESGGVSDRPNYLWVLLALVVLASFAVRVAAWVHWQTGAIESEGAEYARIAENLRSGIGYVGLVTPGSELTFNPLFPLLIAGVSFLTHNYELAGRLVVLIMGALMPLPVFGIGSRLFSWRVGLIAALLTLLHPLLVHLSFTVLSEGPYTFLLLCAVYLVICGLNRPSTSLWLLVGASFGLTYLLRAEATAAFTIAVLFALVATKGSRRVRCKRALAAVVMFAVMVLPEVILIYRSTGRIRLEGKSTIFSYTGRRILAAETAPRADYESAGGRHEVPSPEPNSESGRSWEEKWAFYGIDSHLQGMGFPMRSHAEVIRETQISPRDLFRLFEKGVRLNAPEVFRRLSSDWLGAPLLPALALLGALRRPWRGSQTSGRVFVVLIMSAPILATFFALWNEQRYYFVLVPLLCIWAANGLFEVGLWTMASASAAGWTILARPIISRCIVPSLIALAMLVGSISGVGKIYVFADSALPSRVDKQLGVWIAAQSDRPVRIMDLALPLTYHANAQFEYFPYCTGPLALRYLEAKKVDYIILRRGEKFTQYYDEWLTNGIPDRRAERLQLPPVPGADRFVVFRWHRRDFSDTSGGTDE